MNPKEKPANENVKTNLEVGKPLKPFADMSRSFRGCGGCNFEFSKLYLTFGGVDFELIVNQNEGLDVEDEQEGVDVFYEIWLKGRIENIEKLNWLQQHRIDFNGPSESDKITNKNFLATLCFEPEEFYINPETEIEKNGYVDLSFKTDVYNFPFQNDELRSQIEIEVLKIDSNKN